MPKSCEVEFTLSFMHFHVLNRSFIQLFPVKSIRRVDRVRFAGLSRN